MKTVVIDTNVIISAFIGSKTCSKIYELLKKDNFLPLISDDLSTELEISLSKMKFGLSPDEIEDIITHLRRKSKKIIPLGKISICRDPSDNIVLECAAAGKADFIVTGDKDLLSLESFRNIRIVTPHQFIDSINL